MCVSLLALVIALGGAGYAANGGSFILGARNSATARTSLTAGVNDSSLLLRNPSTGASSTALDLRVAEGKPPMKVNSATKVAKLNADRLDGFNSTAFARIGTNALWQYIGDSGEPGFENGWRNYDGAVNHVEAMWQHVAYRMDRFGRVELRGLIAGGTVGQVMFRLQQDYCPRHYHLFPVLSNNAIARVNVSWYSINGDCLIYAETGSNAWIGLDGIAWETWRLEGRVAAQLSDADRSLPSSAGAGQITSLPYLQRHRGR
jgi:hypothetical protein